MLGIFESFVARNPNYTTPRVRRSCSYCTIWIKFYYWFWWRICVYFIYVFLCKVLLGAGLLLFGGRIRSYSNWKNLWNSKLVNVLVLVRLKVINVLLWFIIWLCFTCLIWVSFWNYSYKSFVKNIYRLLTVFAKNTA